MHLLTCIRDSSCLNVLRYCPYIVLDDIGAQDEFKYVCHITSFGSIWFKSVVVQHMGNADAIHTYCESTYTDDATEQVMQTQGCHFSTYITMSLRNGL